MQIIALLYDYSGGSKGEGLGPPFLDDQCIRMEIYWTPHYPGLGPPFLNGWIRACFMTMLICRSQIRSYFVINGIFVFLKTIYTCMLYIWFNSLLYMMKRQYMYIQLNNRSEL